MPKLNIKVPHQLTQEEALRRTRTLLENVKNQYSEKISDVREEWEGNLCQFSFSAMGFSTSGTLTVKPSEIEISGNLPFAAAFFKGKIEATIRERAEKWFA